MVTQSALANIDPDYLIARITDGAYLRDLAAETGIDKRRLSEQLRKHPDYPAAKECAIECQLDSAQDALEVSSTPMDIARARERWRAATWRAEREVPARWAQKSEIAVSFVPLGDALREARARADAIDITPPLCARPGTQVAPARAASR